LNKKIFIIFLTVFIDLLGFGIIIPILPIFAVNELEMSEAMIGLNVGIFSLMNFIFSPLWGRLSDIYGRKPILIFGLAGNILSYILLGLVLGGVLKHALMLFVSRAMAGFFSANIGATMAYISDVTKPDDRAKGMGLIGAAFGLGFIFGPFIGGFMSKRLGYSYPVFFAALLSGIALLLTLVFVSESLRSDLRRKGLGKFTFSKIIGKYRNVIFNNRPGLIIIFYFATVFSLSNIFSTFQLFTENPDYGFGFDVEQVSYLFAFSGLVSSVTQGILIRLLLKLFDDKKIFIISCVIMAIGLAAIPFTTGSLLYLVMSVLFMSSGNGLCLSIGLGLISKFSEPDQQGSILGFTQSLASLARFLGPSWGGLVYHFISYSAPFLTGGIVMLIISIFSVKLLKYKHSH
jgi:DHA1 family tetracycline resistance protein-like MFS transporter